MQYITTPIYYVNDVPHIGHSYTTIIADIFARFFRIFGEDVYFLTGTDEHGQKIEKVAQQWGISPQTHVDEVVVKYQQAWKRLNISMDRFIRTTDADHKLVVQKVFSKLYESGLIYLGNYEGLYCHHCESYYTKTQVEENKCPDCSREVSTLSEEAYFFKLSAFEDQLLKHIAENPEFVLPATRKNEVVSFINQGLEDLCISRTSISGGIEVPLKPEKGAKPHYIYVWFDALINYLTGVGYLNNDAMFARYWPATLQLVGKDILKFHCIIWPAMLMGLDIALPKHVLAHGFIYQGGEKMSKSKGNVLDPHRLIDTFGVDAVRFFLSREMMLGQDGTYTDENMIVRYNSELANDYGNLVNRTINMIKKYFNSTLPENYPDSTKMKSSPVYALIPNLIHNVKESIYR